MERGLLSSPELAQHYGDVVWLYLYQDFTHSEADLQAERIALRFGISSWPQHFLIDPADLSILADTGRELASFTAALEGKRVGDRPKPGLDELRAYDALAASIRAAETASLAEEHLDHTDPVVRLRAAERLRAERPLRLVEQAAKLLAIEHDQLRYEVCKALSEHGDVTVARALDAVLRDPGRSRNPNVVRMHVARALGRCGDLESLAALAPFAASGEVFNGLTRTSVDAVAAVAARCTDARERALQILVSAFPELPEADPTQSDELRERRLEAATRLAEHVHEALMTLTGTERAFPTSYDAGTRRALVRAWQEG